MADTKISALTEHTTLDADDLLPIVDNVASATKNVKLSTVIPDGGTADQVLAKASGTDYDLEWQDGYDADAKRVAVVEWQGAHNTYVNTASGLNLPLYDTILYDGIGAGFEFGTADSLTAGTMRLAVGTYLIDMTLQVYNTLRSRIYIRDSSLNYVLWGPTVFATGTGNIATLKGVLAVTSGTEIYTTVLSVGQASSYGMGMNDYRTEVTTESFGQIVVQQLSE